MKKSELLFKTEEMNLNKLSERALFGDLKEYSIFLFKVFIRTDSGSVYVYAIRTYSKEDVLKELKLEKISEDKLELCEIDNLSINRDEFIQYIIADLRTFILTQTDTLNDKLWERDKYWYLYYDCVSVKKSSITEMWCDIDIEKMDDIKNGGKENE